MFASDTMDREDYSKLREASYAFSQAHDAYKKQCQRYDKDSSWGPDCFLAWQNLKKEAKSLKDVLNSIDDEHFQVNELKL